MNVGDRYEVPAGLPAGESVHVGHVIEVLAVHRHPASDGPDVDPGGPDTVDVRCSCGSAWTFEDRGDAS